MLLADSSAIVCWELKNVTIGAAIHLKRQGEVAFRTKVWQILTVLNLHEVVSKVMKMLTLSDKMTQKIITKHVGWLKLAAYAYHAQCKNQAFGCSCKIATRAETSGP
jgi:hypothetical protein